MIKWKTANSHAMDLLKGQNLFMFLDPSNPWASDSSFLETSALSKLNFVKCLGQITQCTGVNRLEKLPKL